jgi:hypothetical protein
MKNFIQYFAVLICGLLLTLQSFAQLDGNPGNLCRNGIFPRENGTYQLASIIGKRGQKAYFYGDERADCPRGANCRRGDYVVPGNEIIVSRALGSYACAWFQPKKGTETVGWIRIDDLAWIETNENPETADWVGKWRFYDDTIVIAKSPAADLFAIKGSAVWKGLGDNIHIGELDHQAKPKRNKLTLGEADPAEYPCKAWMQLVGKYLIVSDNLNCGGANVTFSGVYQKKLK